MKVTKFEKIERFKDFSLIKGKDNHSICKFSFVSAAFDDYSDLVGSNVEVTEGNQTFMYAYIADVTFVTGNSENVVEVTLLSRSKNIDVDVFTRVFHKEKHTYKEILDEVVQKNKYELNVPASLNEAKLEHPIVQSGETDYMFIKRLVREAYGQEIVIDVEDEKILVGFLENTKHEVKQNEIFSISQKINLETKILEFAIKGDSEGRELREYINIGKQIIWQGDTFVITNIEISKREGVFRYKCYATCGTLIKDKAEDVLETLRAKVVDVADPDNLGRVRLDFSSEIIEDMTSDDKVWCNVLTPYTAKTGGFVFVPDVDDLCEVLWNGVEFIIAGCVRQESLSERYQDIKLKQIGNLYEKNICFSEDKIEITSKDVNVSIMDEEIQVLLGDSEINVTKDKIDIRTKRSVIEMNDDVTVETGKVHIDSDALETKVKKNYTCESKNITLNASAIATIEGKTKVSIN